MVAVGGGGQYFKIKERMRREVDAFKSTSRRFQFDNFRRYRGRQFGARGFIGFGNGRWDLVMVDGKVPSQTERLAMVEMSSEKTEEQDLISKVGIKS